jgi:hypothetical protein
MKSPPVRGAVALDSYELGTQVQHQVVASRGVIVVRSSGDLLGDRMHVPR